MRAMGWGLAVGLAGLLGCGPGGKPPVYQDERGFRFTPPPGWVERVRPSAVTGGPAQGLTRGRATTLPLPPLGVASERLLVRYDRLTAGRQAWLRLTVADVPPSVPLAACLAHKAPGAKWRREAEEGDLEVGGKQAARVSFTGRWDEQDYRSETAAVRAGERVYFVAASFPAQDAAARTQVWQAVAGAAWK